MRQPGSGCTATLSGPCGSCPATAVEVVSESVVEGRLAWSVHRRCAACGAQEYGHGRDRLPAPLRAALIERCGLARVRIEPGFAGRVRVIALLRASGATRTAAATAFDRLVEVGMTGTTAEMDLLAARLTAIGARVVRDTTRP